MLSWLANFTDVLNQVKEVFLHNMHDFFNLVHLGQNAYDFVMMCINQLPNVIRIPITGILIAIIIKFFLSLGKQ